MIVVTVEYELATWGPDIDFEKIVESVVGKVFEEEQDHVEVRVRPLTEYDQYERALCFTIDVSRDTMHHDPYDLGNQFIVEIKEQVEDLPPFWVWVRRIEGSFTEAN